MLDWGQQAEVFRRRALQPTADLAVVHLRVDPFLIAVALIAVSIGIEGALDSHKFLTGRWSGISTVVEVPWISFKLWVASHLLRYRRDADRSKFRIVHPVFRNLETIPYANLVFGGVISLCSLAPFALSHPSAWGVFWETADLFTLVSANLGALFAACEWRKLPPARKRERASVGMFAPGTA